MMLNSRIAFFSEDKIALMRKRVFDLLERRGAKMDHPEVLKLLSKAGAMVDFGTQIVRFPKSFVEEMIGEAPRKFTLGAKNKKNRLKVPRQDGTFHFRTGSGARSYIDPMSGSCRKITLSDVATVAKLAEQLDQIDSAATQSPTDVPSALADVYAVKAVLENTQKHVWVQPSSPGIFYLTLGFIADIFLGNIIMICMALIVN